MVTLFGKRIHIFRPRTIWIRKVIQWYFFILIALIADNHTLAENGTGILLSESWFRALLKKKGYRYRFPKHDLSHFQDKTAKKKAEKLLEERKKRASETMSSSSLWVK